MDENGVDLTSKQTPGNTLSVGLNDSDQPADFSEKQQLDEKKKKKQKPKHHHSQQICSVRNVLTVIILCFINLINYLDRYTTAAVVGRLKEAFNINDKLAGLIQTCFIISYMITSPVFGYLGDRYTRRYIMSFGLFIWAGIGLASSFVPEDSYLLLLLTRALIGVGEAAYTNLCPSIISDMFVGQPRTLVLTIYQFAVPLGCGVGYMLASAVAEYFDDWRWAYRITPPIIVLLAIVLALYVREPPRGHSENATHLQATGFKKDILYIIRIPSFMLTSFAFTCVAFALGALSYWTVNMVSRVFIMNGVHVSESEIGYIFGLITIAAGVGGVATGVIVSNKILKPRIGARADTLVCGVGMLIAGPTIYVALILIQHNLSAAWCMMFVGIAALCCCWVLVIDITMTIVIATRRATAEAVQMIIGHLFGDAASPYIIGIVSDQLQYVEGGGISVMAQFKAMQQALFIPTFVVICSGCLFLFASLYINEDAANAKKLSSRQGAVHADESEKTAMKISDHPESKTLLAAESNTADLTADTKV